MQGCGLKAQGRAGSKAQGAREAETGLHGAGFGRERREGGRAAHRGCDGVHNGHDVDEHVGGVVVLGAKSHGGASVQRARLFVWKQRKKKRTKPTLWREGEARKHPRVGSLALPFRIKTASSPAPLLFSRQGAQVHRRLVEIWRPPPKPRRRSFPRSSWTAPSRCAHTRGEAERGGARKRGVSGIF